MLLLCLISLVFFGILFVLVRFLHIKSCLKTASPKRTAPSKTLIVLGSGGHTTEMLALVKELSEEKYSPRTYVLASSDEMSRKRVLEQEAEAKDYEVISIYRSRRVGQSYVTSVFTTIQSTLQCFPLVLRIRPDLVLCNGPGTCVPICLVAYLLKMLFICTHTKIVFIESYCRVKTISLSGKILKYFVDLFIVQWPELSATCKDSIYLGKLL